MFIMSLYSGLGAGNIYFSNIIAIYHDRRFVDFCLLSILLFLKEQSTIKQSNKNNNSKYVIFNCRAIKTKLIQKAIWSYSSYYHSFQITCVIKHDLSKNLRLDNLGEDSHIFPLSSINEAPPLRKHETHSLNQICNWELSPLKMT